MPAMILGFVCGGRGLARQGLCLCDAGGSYWVQVELAGGVPFKIVTVEGFGMARSVPVGAPE